MSGDAHEERATAPLSAAEPASSTESHPCDSEPNLNDPIGAEMLAAMRGRDRRVVARLGNPDADPFLRAEMDRRALLAEVDRLTAALATAARERDALGDAYREAIGVPESQHQRERMERIASAYEQAVAERDAAQARLAKVAKMRDLWRESAGEDRDMESKTIRAVAAYLDVALSDEGIGQ